MVDALRVLGVSKPADAVPIGLRRTLLPLELPTELHGIDVPRFDSSWSVIILHERLNEERERITVGNQRMFLLATRLWSREHKSFHRPSSGSPNIWPRGRIRRSGGNVRVSD